MRRSAPARVPGRAIRVRHVSPDGIPRESHPFTIASAPAGEPCGSPSRDSATSPASDALRPGARAQLEGPFGSFHLQRRVAHAQTWIAGGIGITPFLSWARSLDGSVPIDLYYCTPGAEQAHFLDELFDIADRYPTFRVIPIRKSSLGRLSVDDIEAVNPNRLERSRLRLWPAGDDRQHPDGVRSRGMPPRRHSTPRTSTFADHVRADGPPTS